MLPASVVIKPVWLSAVNPACFDATRLAKKIGLDLRQNCTRLGKLAPIKHQRYAHAKQLKRAGKAPRKLKTYLGRSIRDIARQIAGEDELQSIFRRPLKRSKDGQFALHAKALPGNPYDGHTLAEVIPDRREQSIPPRREIRIVHGRLLRKSIKVGGQGGQRKPSEANLPGFATLRRHRFGQCPGGDQLTGSDPFSWTVPLNFLHKETQRLKGTA